MIKFIVTLLGWLFVLWAALVLLAPPVLGLMKAVYFLFNIWSLPASDVKNLHCLYFFMVTYI